MIDALERQAFGEEIGVVLACLDASVDLAVAACRSVKRVRASVLLGSREQKILDECGLDGKSSTHQLQ